MYFFLSSNLNVNKSMARALLTKKCKLYISFRTCHIVLQFYLTIQNTEVYVKVKIGKVTLEKIVTMPL